MAAQQPREKLTSLLQCKAVKPVQFLWDIIVAVLDDIVCDGGEPVFGEYDDVGVPRVVELQLPGGSYDDDVEGCIGGRVGWQINNPSGKQRKRYSSVIHREPRCSGSVCIVD